MVLVLITIELPLFCIGFNIPDNTFQVLSGRSLLVTYGVMLILLSAFSFIPVFCVELPFIGRNLTFKLSLEGDLHILTRDLLSSNHLRATCKYSH